MRSESPARCCSLLCAPIAGIFWPEGLYDYIPFGIGKDSNTWPGPGPGHRHERIRTRRCACICSVSILPTLDDASLANIAMARIESFSSGTIELMNRARRISGFLGIPKHGHAVLTHPDPATFQQRIGSIQKELFHLSLQVSGCVLDSGGSPIFA